MYCSNCGSRIVDGAQFCSECGQPVKGRQPQAMGPVGSVPGDTVPAAPADAPRVRRPLLVAGLAAGTVALALAVFACGWYVTGLWGWGSGNPAASSQDASKETSAAEPSATNAAGEAEAATDDASAENAAATKDVASTEAQSSPEPEAAAEAAGSSEPVGPQTFEGTIRIAGGEDAAALCGTDIYAQGEDEAYRIRNTSYAFLVFDQPITIEGVSCDDGVKSIETDIILIGATSDLGWEDAGVLVSALKFMQYSDQRARITCEYLTKTGETAVIDVPRAMYAEVESIL